MASVSSVSVPGQGQRLLLFYWTLWTSTLNRIGEYCKLASGKIKAVVYKQVREQDEDKKIEDKVSILTETVKVHLDEEPDKYSSTDDSCKTYLCDDTMPKSDENMLSKNTNTANLFPNADKLADQKNEEDMLSIVESIVTAKLETVFCTNTEHKDQSSTSENNAEEIIQDAVCTSPSDLQKTDGGAEELRSAKHSDGNNNDAKSVTPCTLKVNDKQKSTCKITSTESSKATTEAKDKDGHIKTNNITKTGIKAGSNTHLTKDAETIPSPSIDSKKVVSNSSKSLSTTDKNGRDHFNNKQNNAKITCVKKQEFVKQRNVSKIEKEMKNTITKPNFAKTSVETSDTTCQSKNSNKDKALQKQQQTTSKQFASRSKGQESLKKNTSTFNFSDDKNKAERATHTPENVDSPLNESERKNEKIVNEKHSQNDQKANRGDFRKNTTFVSQYKNSTFSKPTQNIPRTGQAPMYGRNPSYAYNNPRFDRDRNGSADRRVPKKEHTPMNTFIKSNIEIIEELNTSNLENCTKQKKEIIQPINVKSTCEVDALVFNDRKDINPVKVETHLIQDKENTKSSVDHLEQGPITSVQCHVETNDISKVDIDQQHRETNIEETDPFKHSSNLPSDKYATNSQINVTHQYSLKLENMQRTNDLHSNQFESNQATWNQLSDNAAQKDATIMNLQESIQSMHFNTQQTFIQAGNPTRQMSPWEPNNSKFYDQHFSVSDAMRLSQIPNNFNVPPYECNAPISSDNSVAAMSTLETTSNNRENSNVLYRYGPNVQQRPVMASDYPGHSISSYQTNQARWSSSVQDGFHVEHPYVATQPTMMHVYNPAVFSTDDFNNTHTMDYVSHPVIYAPSPYMQTWNSQLQYPIPVLYNSPCTNYTTFSHNQPNNFNNSIHDQQHNQNRQHNPYAQMNNYVRDTYNDTNTCAVPGRNTADNVPIRSNYYYKKYQDSCRTVYDVPQYVPPVSYPRTQQGMNFTPVTGMNQYNVPYCPPNQKYYRQNMGNYTKNPKSQIQDSCHACDDNGSEDIPPIISPKEFVTDNINLSNKTDQFATRVFKPEFKTRSNSGYRPPSSFPKYNSGFRRNTTFQDFPKECTYPVSIGRGTYKTKRT